MGRGEFPVDTHVLRIAKGCNWVSSSETREGAYKILNDIVPDDIKMDLHCLLVRHGKVCHKCAANGRPQFPPADGPLVCPLRRYGGKREKSSCVKEEGETVEPPPKKKKKKKNNVAVKKEEEMGEVKVKAEVKMERVKVEKVKAQPVASVTPIIKEEENH